MSKPKNPRKKRQDRCHCSVCKSKQYSNRDDLPRERRADEKARELKKDAELTVPISNKDEVKP